ncbi:GNAT family N-acetyltransferase [Porphyromonas levii]|uniref:GNAT family N-acetyltransferase n=2 Tax=Porphyromonas levii TaxID=28114 RepID=UPI001BADC04D|nr:GNAT family N-acetyltransferase [Porphyromonas levii]MBR8806261.1 hypothetical protein [Porphyromonas levii]
MMNEQKLLEGWMKWDEIVPYKQQLIEMERDLMITYHYPDWDIPWSFVESKVNELEIHLTSGNTFFWGLRDETKLYGYYWGYISNFINRKRWNLRSIYFLQEAKGKGFGKKSFDVAESKARELNCIEMATHYAVFNEVMEHTLKTSGYTPTRIEMVKSLRE